MPRDLTPWAIQEVKTNTEFKKRYGVDRAAVEAGEIKIIKAGDGSEHPIESEYLASELHSPMTIDRPVVRAADLDRVVLLVGKPLSALKGTWVGRYLRYGETHAFASGKSKPVPVPERSTCAGRDPWYDLTKLVKPGLAFWPKAQQYRHIIAHNPDQLICNCNLYDLSPKSLSNDEAQTLVGILNSTLVGFFKTFYGRFAGTEGDLKTEIIDVELLEVPDPRGASSEVVQRIIDKFARLTTRPIGRLVEEDLMECHSTERAKAIGREPLRLADELRQSDRRALDDAVFELLGATDLDYRNRLVDRLHEETARHFRQIRIVEIQKQEQRARTGVRRFTANELAADAWDAIERTDVQPLKQWAADKAEPLRDFIIPESGPVSLASASDMYDCSAVYFGQGRRAIRLSCDSRTQAELLAKFAGLGLRGSLGLPTNEQGCRDTLARLEAHLAAARSEFEALAESRAGDEKIRAEITTLLMHWLVHGRGKQGNRRESPRDNERRRSRPQTAA